MGGVSGYIFAIMWLIIAIYLIFQGFKSSKLYFVPAIFFIYMAVWYFINEQISIDLFSGMYGWIFRIVAIVFLVIIILLIVLKRKNVFSKHEENEEETE